MKEFTMIPNHIAIIMDGNGRWAKSRGKQRIFGHYAGIKSLRKIINAALEREIKVLTLYAFSSENWRRSEEEISALMFLFITVLNKEIRKLHKNNVRFDIIGDISRFDKKLQAAIEKGRILTANNTGMVLNIAANYGGRWDIVTAAKIVADKVKSGVLAVEQIDEAEFGKYICLNEIPPVDFVIRTGGDYRISNFLLWQIAYAEFYFTETYWPDFDCAAFNAALTEFQKRERRFGGISNLEE